MMPQVLPTGTQVSVEHLPSTHEPDRQSSWLSQLSSSARFWHRPATHFMAPQQSVVKAQLESAALQQRYCPLVYTHESATSQHCEALLHDSESSPMQVAGSGRWSQAPARQ